MISTSPPQVATYNKAIKVTVDGPREPRSKTRQQQQFHFAFGQRPFPFAASDPLSGFRMPPIANCNNMSQFGLSTTNSHWGYGAASAYSPYFTPSSLGSCATPTTTQFNTPALGFSGSAPDQTSTQDAFTTGGTTLLPDSTAPDLDQHLGVVSSNTHTTQPSAPHHHHSSLLVPRYSNMDFSVTNAGPRSLSDNSSAADSPVQDDLLSTSTQQQQTPQTNPNPTFPPLHQNVSVGASPYTSATGNCNNSLYPVLPASLLYSQLYSAANQTHSFGIHHHSQGTGHHHHSELQSVMDQLGGHQRMNGGVGGGGGGELVLQNGGSCAAAAARQDDGHARGQRGPGQSGDAVVWRPY